MDTGVLGAQHAGGPPVSLYAKSSEEGSGRRGGLYYRSCYLLAQNMSTYLWDISCPGPSCYTPRCRFCSDRSNTWWLKHRVITLFVCYKLLTVIQCGFRCHVVTMVKRIPSVVCLCVWSRVGSFFRGGGRLFQVSSVVSSVRKKLFLPVSSGRKWKKPTFF